MRIIKIETVRDDVMTRFSAFLVLFLVTIKVSGQAALSSFSDNGGMVLSEGISNVIYSQKLFLGPNTDWVIDGDLYIYSQEIWIAPTAKIRGSGRLVLRNPGTNPYYENLDAIPTFIDGNGGDFIGVNIVIDNPNNIKLFDIDDPGYELNSLVDKVASLNISANIEFNAQGGDILLNGFTLALGERSRFLNSGTVDNPAQNLRGYIITDNLPNSYLVKSMARQESFLFPVGISEMSYSPAILKPLEASAIHVGLVDYSVAGTQIDDPAVGMDRIWHIHGDRSLKADFTLVHETVTNGELYLDQNAKIMQYSGGGNWIGDISTVIGQGIHSRQDILLGAVRTDPSSWFTKFGFRGPQAEDDVFEVPYADYYDPQNNRFYVLANDRPVGGVLDATSIRITKLPLSGTITVNSDGTVTYIPQAGFLGEDIFEYSITDSNGLIDSAQVVIRVVARDLKIPNVFTPNGDGFNDTFEIIGNENFDVIGLTVVNRWGNEVYRNMRYNNTWDGGGLNEGTYFYIIEAKKGNQIKVYKGDILIKLK